MKTICRTWNSPLMPVPVIFMVVFYLRPVWLLADSSSLFCLPPGPRLDMDPDIVAALDDDFNYEDPDNILDDDFIIKANRTSGEMYTE